jgi:hypothetical protein
VTGGTKEGRKEGREDGKKVAEGRKKDKARMKGRQVGTHLSISTLHVCTPDSISSHAKSCEIQRQGESKVGTITKE